MTTQLNPYRNEMERSSGPPAAPQDAINSLPDAVITEGQVSSFHGYYCGLE